MLDSSPTGCCLKRGVLKAMLKCLRLQSQVACWPIAATFEPLVSTHLCLGCLFFEPPVGSSRRSRKGANLKQPSPNFVLCHFAMLILYDPLVRGFPIKMGHQKRENLSSPPRIHWATGASRRQVCSSLGSRALSMVALACFWVLNVVVFFFCFFFPGLLKRYISRPFETCCFCFHQNKGRPPLTRQCSGVFHVRIHVFAAPWSVLVSGNP